MSKTLIQELTTEHLTIEQSGHTGWITFNDPARHNAVSLAMWEGIPPALARFESDDDIRSVVVTGAGGKAFVSGANISQFDKLRTGRDAVEHYEQAAEGAQLALQNFPKPLIARIDGYCIGGGMNIALCCDIRFASESSSMSIPAARLGLGYRFSAIQNLVRAVGAANALDIFLSAERYSAARAKELGLVQYVVPKEELDQALAGYLEKINANAPLTMAAGKNMIKLLTDRTADIDMQEMKRLVIQCFESADYKEGKLAFAEKRQPVFTGK